jgi:hypothetical protein
MQNFGSKNEWKRHIYSQHLNFHYWRCDHPICVDVKGTFNRKDLFGQHIRRMHPSDSPSAAARVIERCKHERRRPPVWTSCGQCGKEWGPQDEFGDKLEHVGIHMERAAKGKMWAVDEEIVTWALGQGIVERVEGEGQGEKEYRLATPAKPGTRGQKNVV